MLGIFVITSVVKKDDIYSIVTFEPHDYMSGSGFTLITQLEPKIGDKYTLVYEDPTTESK